MQLKSWFTITADATKKTARIDINGVIGSDTTALVFRQQIQKLAKDGITAIDLYVDSPGGSVWEGVSISNDIKAFPGTVTGYVPLLAASMGTVILMACKKVYMHPKAMLMIHDPSLSFDSVKVEQLDGIKDMMVHMKETMVGMYCEKTGLPEGRIETIMNAETWLSAEKAKALGFIDGIIESMDYKAVANYSIAACDFKNLPASLKSQITNFKSHNTRMNKEIALALGLKEDASEQEILTALSAALKKAPEDKGAGAAAASAGGSNDTLINSLVALGRKTGFVNDTNEATVKALAAKDFDSTLKLVSEAPAATVSPAGTTGGKKESI